MRLSVSAVVPTSIVPLQLTLVLQLALFVQLGLAAAAFADPTTPVTVSLPPVEQGEIQVPARRHTAQLRPEYVEEEYFVSGFADIYTYAETPVRGEVVIQPPNAAFPQTEDVPYTTRIIIKRPVDPANFSGTLVIEWWNSTAGFDTAPSFDPAAEFFAREGWIYVGITNSTTSVGFLEGGCFVQGFPFADCQTRYESLDFSENGLVWDMVTQISHMLKNPDDPQNPLPEGYEVERLYHTGQSQQGGSLITYASTFHSDINDGYFVQGATGARRINYGPACGSDPAVPYPECTPQLQGSDRWLATDLPVPVLQGLSETDAVWAAASGTRQPDQDLYRFFEIAGASHVTVHKNIDVVPGLITLERFCGNEMNTIADGPVLGSLPQRAMWKAMDEYVQNGSPIPPGKLIDSAEGVLLRDANGNTTGGVRTTDMDVPTARYEPNNTFDPTLPPFLHDIAELACRLSGSVFPFSPVELMQLYPRNQDYVDAVSASADALVAEGWLLPEDVELLIVRAHFSGIGCGLGFEIALALPLLFWLRARHRARGDR